MKKKLVLILILSLLLIFTACSGGGTKDPTPKNPSNPGSIENQLDLIADYEFEWAEDIQDAADACFCVTDLDRNGRLEIIISYMEGTGYFSYTSLYEVSEDFTHLEAVDTSCFDDASEPDLLWMDKYRCYLEDGNYYYVVEDIVRNSYAEVYFIKDFICLKDGVLYADYYGYAEGTVDIVHGEDELWTKYYNASDIQTSGDYFGIQLDHEFFPNAKATEVKGFCWERYHDASDELPKLLEESYGNFEAVQKYADDVEFFEYPATYFGLKEHEEIGIWADGKYGIPYRRFCNKWTFLYGETDGCEFSADDGVDCWIEFFDDGTATFYYSQNGNVYRYKNMEVEQEFGELYSGCINDEWYITFENDRTNSFSATTADGILEMLWYQGDEADEYAAVCLMTFALER